jgi:adenine-specific DNA-methyltransferase
VVTEPRYDDGACRMWHARAEDWLPTLPDASVDLILTDPPFFRVKDEDWDRQWRDGAAYLRWLGGIADEWRRVLKPNGSLYCFASPDMAARVEVLLGERFRVLNGVRWLKEDGWHQKADKEELRAYLSPWEAIVFCEQVYADRDADDLSGYGEACRTLHQKVYSPLGRYIAQERERAGLTRNEVEVALGFTSTGDPTRGTALCYRWEEGSSLPTKETYERLRALLNERGRKPGDPDYLRREYDDLRRPFALTKHRGWSDVWRFRTVPGGPGKHPCEKPIALLEHCITASTRPGALVVDCFAGSGSTLRAAKNLGRLAWGCEADARWARRAAERCRQLPMDLGEEVVG